MGSKRAKEKKAGDKPGFDEAALAQLTSKIDQSLPVSDSKERPAKRKRQRDLDDDRDSKRRHTPRPSSEHAPQVDGRGKRKKQQTQALLDEILALGGDEADLELVANVDSGDEGGDAPRPKAVSEAVLDRSLQDELMHFASGLGFSKFHAEQDPQTDEEEGGEEDEEEEVSDVSDAAADGPVDGGEEESEPEETVVEQAPPPQEVRSGKQAKKLIFEPRPDWHGIPSDGLPARASDNVQHHSASLKNLKTHAETLLDADSTKYLALRASSSSQKFMSTIMQSGTLSDKVSALTLSIQESPLHNRKAFENLITLAGKRSRGQAIAALGALVDLLGNGSVLPDNRRLHAFNAQPALLGALDGFGRSVWTRGQNLPAGLTEPHLMMWAYEDWLKAAYFRIIQLLEIWCADEIEYSRTRALDFVFGLLKSKPEQEANLLRLLVNKLGDRERKIASRASYLLLQLLTLHPGMKTIVIGSVEQELLLKPGQSLRTKYSAINTLNQTILSSKEPAVADTLLRIYFDQFLALLKTGSLGDFESPDGDKKPAHSRGKRKKGKGSSGSPGVGNEQEIVQKLVSSLLTGVNRAMPFATSEGATLEKHLDTLFRITHSSNFNTSVQALMLIQQLAASKQLATDRFYRTLYESLLDPRLTTSSKHALYLNLLFRAMKNDVDVRRVKAFVKRLVQVLNLHQPSFICGVLFLIAELHTSFPDLRTLLDEPEDNGDDGEEVYKDVLEDGAGAGDLAPEEQPATVAGRLAATYDGRKRNPEHSNAHRSCLWELMPFLSHYHPSVCLFAGNLLTRRKALPKPDLANHSLMHFLDKFVYRNPKAEESQRGGSIMQPILASGSASHIVASSKSTVRQQPGVNTSSFWNLQPDKVSAEDVFFHEYFARVGKPAEATRAARKKAAAEEQAGSDEEAGEEEIWEALVNSKPDIEGADEDEDSDADVDAFDYSDDDDMEADKGDMDEEMSDAGSEDAEGDDGFEGIFDESEESDDAGSSEAEAAAEDEDERPSKQHRGGRLNRKEMKSLPTFASVDDYAEMLAAEDDLDD